MDRVAAGQRIRQQREFMHMTRERFSELIEVTPKFCTEIELGMKGMSVDTLCRISDALHVPTDYILFGADLDNHNALEPIIAMLESCSSRQRRYAEDILRSFIEATMPLKSLTAT